MANYLDTGDTGRAVSAESDGALFAGIFGNAKYVLENGSITTAETVEVLEVKPRRARAVLRNMVNDGYLRKEGAARSTIYVKNTERK